MLTNLLIIFLMIIIFTPIEKLLIFLNPYIYIKYTENKRTITFLFIILLYFYFVWYFSMHVFLVKYIEGELNYFTFILALMGLFSFFFTVVKNIYDNNGIEYYLGINVSDFLFNMNYWNTLIESRFYKCLLLTILLYPISKLLTFYNELSFFIKSIYVTSTFFILLILFLWVIDNIKSLRGTIKVKNSKKDVQEKNYINMKIRNDLNKKFQRIYKYHKENYCNVLEYYLKYVHDEERDEFLKETVFNTFTYTEANKDYIFIHWIWKFFDNQSNISFQSYLILFEEIFNQIGNDEFLSEYLEELEKNDYPVRLPTKISNFINLQNLEDKDFNYLIKTIESLNVVNEEQEKLVRQIIKNLLVPNYFKDNIPINSLNKYNIELLNRKFINRESFGELLYISLLDNKTEQKEKIKSILNHMNKEEKFSYILYELLTIDYKDIKIKMFNEIVLELDISKDSTIDTTKVISLLKNNTANRNSIHRFSEMDLNNLLEKLETKISLDYLFNKNNCYDFNMENFLLLKYIMTQNSILEFIEVKEIEFESEEFINIYNLNRLLKFSCKMYQVFKSRFFLNLINDVIELSERYKIEILLIKNEYTLNELLLLSEKKFFMSSIKKIKSYDFLNFTICELFLNLIFIDKYYEILKTPKIGKSFIGYTEDYIEKNNYTLSELILEVTEPSHLSYHERKIIEKRFNDLSDKYYP